MHNKLKQGVYYEIREPIITWEDIGGYFKEKEKVKQMVSLPLILKSELEKQHIELPSGVMIWGPLGVGIKMVAEASANEAKVKLVYISGREILGKPDELRNGFREARINQPCVLFVSDTEWLAPLPGADYAWNNGFYRGKPAALADREMTTVFLEELDNISGMNGISLVGSCYRLDVVDQSLFKEKSRFNRKIFFPPPPVSDREEILRIYLSKIDLRWKDIIDIKEIAAFIEGYTGWDIQNLCKEAVLLAVQNKKQSLTKEYFKKAFNNIKPWLTKEMIKKYFELYEQDCPHYYNF